MLRWGILSTAKIGLEHIIPAILKANNSIVTAIASRSQEKGQAIAERFGIPQVFADYQAMLDSDVIDAVYIPLPTSQHVEWSIKAADAGKHVLCEKPIALHADEIDGIIAARDRNHVVVSEAFMVTYHPQWHKARELLDSGAVGELTHVQASFTYFNKDPNNMRNIPALGGGVLPDIGVYPTVTTRFATGKEPQRVSATVKRDPVFGTDTYASCRVDYGDFEMSMYLSTQLAGRQHICFHGDQGRIELQAPFNAGLFNDDRVTLHNNQHTEIQEFRFPGVDQYHLEIEAFADAILAKRFNQCEKLFSLEDSKRNQKLIDAIYRAGESGQWEAV